MIGYKCAAISTAPEMPSFPMKIWNSSLFLKQFATKRKLKDFKPLPLINDLALTHVTPFGTDYQLTMNFLNRITKLAKVDELTTETIQTCKDTNHSLYEAMIKGEFVIPEAMQRLLKDEFRSLRQVCFAGKGKSISLARRAAFENLAKTMYAIFSCSEDLLPTTESFDVYKTRFAVDVDLPAVAELDAQTRKFLSDCSEVVNEEREDDTESDSFLSEPFDSPCSSVKKKNVPLLHGSLPIYRMAQEIVDSVHLNQVTILSATTGSGKTTQIPKILRDHFENASIVITQPRRVAAISLAERLAHEIDKGPVGSSVGYCVRFDAKYPTKADSNLLFCTSGLLLKKLMSPTDSTLRNCTHLVLDEIHERDTNTDLLLLAVKNLVRKRPNLRVIIMSATLDAAKFYHYFKIDDLQVGKPIVIESPTNFPIKSFHLEDIRLPKRGLDKDSGNYLKEEIFKGSADIGKVPHSLVSNVIADLHLNKPEGAILCFLPGWEDIVAVKAGLEFLLARQNDFKIFCIHSSSSSDETLAMFRPISGVRKLILATNIAESSITIPDVAYIVDSGRQKVMSYRPNLRMNSLELAWISQANSLQRKGRIGRTQPGEYYQLWSKHRSLAANLSPEILRVGLEDVCLTIKGLGFEGKCVDISQKLIDRPDRNLVREAVASLIDIGAFDEHSERITNLGKELASLPLGPSIGKALLLGKAVDEANSLSLLAASVGERLLKIPRFEQDRPVFFDSLRAIKSDFVDDFEFYLTCLRNDHCDSIISRPTKRHALRVAKSLSSQLQISDNSSSASPLSRLLWASAMYPNIAVKALRRNEYLLKTRSLAELPKESMLYRDSIETAIEEGFEVQGSAAKCIVFEELFDAGYRMIIKSSAIDPLVAVLFAHNAVFEKDTLVLDNFICIRGSRDVLNVLRQLRECWKTGSKVIFNPNSDDSLKQNFKELMESFSRHLSLSRPIVYSSTK